MSGFIQALVATKVVCPVQGTKTICADVLAPRHIRGKVNSWMCPYSLRNDRTGFTSAAFTLWKPTVKKAMVIAAAPTNKNTVQWISMR